MSNYATKVALKGTTGVDKYNLAAKSDLASLKTEVDKMVADKIKAIQLF